MRRLSFSIRPATVGDYEQLCCVWEVGDALHRDALPHIFRSSGEPSMDRANVQALIDGSKSAIIVADAVGEVVGVMTIVENRDSYRYQGGATICRNRQYGRQTVSPASRCRTSSY